METALDIIKNTFIRHKGWKHLLFGLGITYLLNLWAYSNYAHSTKLIPSSMMADLSKQSLVGQFIIYLIFITCLACFIEWVQGKFYGAKAQLSDVIWTVVGYVVAFAIYHW